MFKNVGNKSVKVHPKQKLTFKFLQAKERSNSTFTAKELAEASTYDLKASLKAKLSRSEFGEFIVKLKEGSYKAQNTSGITVEDYAYRTSSNYRILNPTKNLTSTSAKTESRILLDKSVQAILAAIEIYNKPNFAYREETFSILIVNAWELLLKSKIVFDSKENLESLYIKDMHKPNEFVKSRSGNYRTISMGDAIKIITLNDILVNNLKILIELRDNAIHFRNDSYGLNLKLLEVGTASLQSYLEITKEWFKKDLSKYNFYIMPMSFFHSHEMQSYSINSESQQNQNLINYISKKEKEHPFNEDNGHRISLHLETKFVKSKFKFDSDNPDAISVIINEEDKFKTKFIWNYRDHLIPGLRKRYTNFKQDQRFYNLLKEFKSNNKFYQERYLNAKENKGTSRGWYDPNILKEFDCYYIKKG
ncbi:DUF3644 domain-containing protein [Maribacter sp. R86514]|uniref:DUF3644 domain-containing protein n=1 Tax=Maribacter sp. R86514 TaxID=3093854 RepID=UPI0037C6D176